MNVPRDTPVEFVRNWILQQTRLHLPPTWNGGWERWAQGQIALFMEGANGNQVWTEEHIYRNQPANAVDLEFRRPAGVNGVRRFLELKCYSEVNNDTGGRFVARVLEDYEKVRQPLTFGVRGEPSARGSTLWVIGISQQQFRHDIEQAGSRDARWRNFRHVEAVGAGGAGGRATFDIWYCSYVNNH